MAETTDDIVREALGEKAEGTRAYPSGTTWTTGSQYSSTATLTILICEAAFAALEALGQPTLGFGGRSNK